MAHETNRPSFEDDIIVPLRLRPGSLEQLREGVEVRHIRLDSLPDVDGFDLYTESTQPVFGIPAWDAPHSPLFIPAEGES